LNWAVPLPIPSGAPVRAVGALLIFSGLLLGGSAIFQMRRQRTSPGPHVPTTAVVTDGPYRFSRNPIYLGFFLIYLGFSLLTATLWGLVLSPFLLATVNRAIIQPEEIYLGSKFPDDYPDYTRQVRRWI
jgi:protein-S-isoprenylcysteine O-methyltransferase Ste14